MPAIVDVKYFNSFLIKKTVNGDTEKASWPSMPWNPEYYPQFPLSINTGSAYHWYVEESRIRGGFNNTEVDFGVKAYVTEDIDDERFRSNSLVYSGLYNSNTGYNETNVFSVGEQIIKSVDPRYGSVQLLYANDGDMLVFQENKVNRALIDKSAIYAAEGSETLVSTELVLGKITPYPGDYGISRNPESFVKRGYRSYFADRDRGDVMRLSMDGMTSISEYGMSNFFRESLAEISSEYKRYVVDTNWTIPWSVETNQITISGDNILDVELGMTVEGILGYNAAIYVIDIDITGETTANITLSSGIYPASTQTTVISFVKYVKDKVVGGYDVVGDSYVISMSVNDNPRSVDAPIQPIDGEIVSQPSALENA